MVAEDLQQKNLSLAKGYSILMWLRAENINKDSSNSSIVNSSMLYYINTSKYVSLAVYLKKKSLFYKIAFDMRLEDNKNLFYENNADYESPNTNIYYLTDIEYEKWTYLIISHKPSGFLQKSEFHV